MIRERLILAAIGILAGIGWCAERDGRLRAEGRAETAAAAVESLSDSLTVARSLVADVGARADSVREAADSANARNARLIADLRTSRPLVVDTVIREAGPDSAAVRVAVERVAVSYEAEIGLLRATLAQKDAVIASQDSLIAAHVEKDRVSDALIANLRTQVEALHGTRNGWLSRNTERAALVAAGAVTGYVVRELHRP